MISTTHTTRWFALTPLTQLHSYYSTGHNKFKWYWHHTSFSHQHSHQWIKITDFGPKEHQQTSRTATIILLLSYLIIHVLFRTVNHYTKFSSSSSYTLHHLFMLCITTTHKKRKKRLTWSSKNRKAERHNNTPIHMHQISMIVFRKQKYLQKKNTLWRKMRRQKLVQKILNQASRGCIQIFQHRIKLYEARRHHQVMKINSPPQEESEKMLGIWRKNTSWLEENRRKNTSVQKTVNIIRNTQLCFSPNTCTKSKKGSCRHRSKWFYNIFSRFTKTYKKRKKWVTLRQ